MRLVSMVELSGIEPLTSLRKCFKKNFQQLSAANKHIKQRKTIRHNPYWTLIGPRNHATHERI
jgi:hypothetical protein